VDATKAKRAVMVAAAVLVTAASSLVPWLSSFWPVAVSHATAHAAGVVFGPALAAVTLGIVGHNAFTKRIGRNESFNHGGNACAAATAGACAYVWGPKVVFYLLASMAIASIISVLAIPARTIDHDLARGLRDATSDNGDTTGDGPPLLHRSAIGPADAGPPPSPAGPMPPWGWAYGLGTEPGPVWWEPERGTAD
jgi:Major Facilitator Superfamily